MCYAVLDPGESGETSPLVLCIQVDGDDNTQRDREHQVMGALRRGTHRDQGRPLSLAGFFFFLIM